MIIELICPECGSKNLRIEQVENFGIAIICNNPECIEFNAINELAEFVLEYGITK